MYMYHAVGLCTAAETKEEKGADQRADSELSAWKIKPVSALYRMAADTVRAVARMGERLFFKQKSHFVLQFSRRERI